MNAVVRIKRLIEDVAEDSHLSKRQKRRIGQRDRRTKSKEKKNSIEQNCALMTKPETTKHITVVSNTMTELEKMSTDVHKQNEAYGRLFRWSINTQITNEKSKLGDETKQSRILEMKRNKVHRKSGVDAEWNIWFSVKISNIPNSGHGLFSMRRFLKGEIMAYYFGTKTSSPSSAVTKKSYRCGNIDAKGGMSHANSRLLLGVHFANDPTIEKMHPFSIYQGARYEVKKSQINARLTVNGALIAMKQICFGEEIYVGYAWSRL